MANKISVAFVGVTEAMNKLAASTAKMDEATRLAVGESALLIVNKAKQNASGRPGPNVKTGRLRSSIQAEGPLRAGIDWVARVGPTVVYGRQIELGGGRWTNGASYPYLGPALQQLTGGSESFEGSVSGAIPRVFERRWREAR